MTYRIERFGWLKDPPDYRDYHARHPAIARKLEHILPVTSTSVTSRTATTGPAGRVWADLRPWCSPVEDQGDIGSCTANATVGALEYFERKSRGVHVDASRLFLYRVTRRFLGWERKGDTGAFIRSAIKALRLFGTVPERYWPYDSQRWDAEPEAFHYAYAQNFKALEYFRLEPSIGQFKSALRSGLPVVFGFTCFDSIDQPSVAKTGIIPYPGPREESQGGHAVLAVGYTDSHVIIRNSWGRTWGDNGYGYLPWTYFDEAHPLAEDFWSITNATWVPDDEADADVRVRRVIPVTTAAERSIPAPESQQTAAEKFAPLIKVVRSTDPIRSVPMRFTNKGLRASPDHAPPVLIETPKPVSLYLKSVTLRKSEDVELWWHATNELYLVAIAWDLSGAPPRVFPDAGAEKVAKGFYMAAAGDTIKFVGDGIQLWPMQTVLGGLYVRILVMESDSDIREAGKQLAAARKAVLDSGLTTALGALAAASSAATLAAVGTAASVLTDIVATAMEKNGDDLVALFDGTYGADNGLSDRSENYDQRGASITLDLKLGSGPPNKVRAKAGVAKPAGKKSRR